MKICLSPLTLVITAILTGIIILVVCLIAPKVVSEEKIEVEAVITEVSQERWVRTVPTIRAGERNEIHFEYEGVQGSWEVDHDTYCKYKDKVGEYIRCYLITRVYDNGETQTVLVEINYYNLRN